MAARLLWLILFFITTTCMDAQPVITGDWHGLLEVPGAKLRLVFHILEKDGVLTATMDSPDQKASGIPAQVVTFEAPELRIKINNLMLEYKGALQEDGKQIKGTFTQAGNSFPLDFRREAIEAPAPPKRPQHPEPPFPYVVEDVSYPNSAAGNTLAGTLTLPPGKGKYPVAILISGSGAHNRDEEMMGHKPFLVLSDFLTRQGIGVLRFDDRGVGKSTGDHVQATSADFATDVEAGMAYLKTRPEVDPRKIGLIGHSEGGLIAPMVAAQGKEVAFIILLAGPGVPGDELLFRQQALMGKASGMSDAEIQKNHAFTSKSYQLIKESGDPDQWADLLRADFWALLQSVPSSAALPEDQKETAFQQTIRVLRSPWFRFFIKTDPGLFLQQVKCPVLALNGDKDLQVDHAQNLPAIAAALKKVKNRDVTTIVLPGLNHLFQTAGTGNMDEYEKIEETFAPAALQAMVDWLKPRVLKKQEPLPKGS